MDARLTLLRGFQSLLLALTVVACHEGGDQITAAGHRPASVVSAAPPDFVDEELYAQENLTTDDRYEGWFMRDVVLIRFAMATTQVDRQAAVDTVEGTQVGGRLFGDDGDGIYVVHLAADSTNDRLFAAISTLKNFRGVRWASPNEVYFNATTYLRPNDGLGLHSSDWRLEPDSAFGNPSRLGWALEAVHAPFAWGCATGDTTRVATLDMGIHRDGDIIPNLASGIPAFPADTFSHGTDVASVLAARGNDGVGMTGMMWNAHLEPRDVSLRNADGTPNTSVDSQGNVTETTDWLSMAAAIAQVLNHGARVINISLGQNGLHAGPHTYGQDSARWSFAHRIADEIRFRTVHPLWVISAGNMTAAGDTYWEQLTAIADSLPTETLIVTGAGSTRGSLSPGATGVGSISIAAPGEAVAVMDSRGVHQATGTSFATPLVSGAAGLLFSFDPTLTASQVRQYLVDGAINGGRHAASYPLLDVYESLKLAGARQGAPLCGNRVWIENRQVVAQRETSNEVLAQLDPTWYGAYLNLKHGGHRFEVDYGYGFVHDDSTHLWTQVEGGRDANALDGGMFSSYNGSSHDGDVWVGAQSTTNSSTHEKSIVVSAYDSTGTRILTTMHFGSVVPGLQCGRKTGSDVLTGDGWFTIRGPYICSDSTAAGSWSEVANVAPYPSIAPDGESLLIPIDTWADTATGGPFVKCDSTSQNDTNNLPLEICLSSTITRKLIRTDVYEIPLHGTVPANLESNPKWTIANRGIYWMALSEDNKEFGAGFVTLSSTITGGTGSGYSGSTATMNCTNEYRSSFSNTQAFGTLLSATPSDAPNGEPSCWVDAGSGVSSIRSALSLKIAEPSMASGQPQSLPSSRRGQIGRQTNPARPLKRAGRVLLPISPAYVVPGGLWSIDGHGNPHLRPTRKIARPQLGNDRD